MRILLILFILKFLYAGFYISVTTASGISNQAITIRKIDTATHTLEDSTTSTRKKDVFFNIPKYKIGYVTRNDSCIEVSVGREFFFNYIAREQIHKKTKIGLGVGMGIYDNSVIFEGRVVGIKLLGGVEYKIYNNLSLTGYYDFLIGSGGGGVTYSVFDITNMLEIGLKYEF